MFQVDQKVRILEGAFRDSDEPQDIALRGQIVTLAFDLAAIHGSDWAGCWEAETGEGELVQLIEGEFEAVQE